MDIRGIVGDYREGPLVAEKDSNWDMMDFVEVKYYDADTPQLQLKTSCSIR